MTMAVVAPGRGINQQLTRCVPASDGKCTSSAGSSSSKGLNLYVSNAVRYFFGRIKVSTIYRETAKTTPIMPMLPLKPPNSRRFNEGRTFLLCDDCNMQLPSFLVSEWLRCKHLPVISINATGKQFYAHY